TPDYLDLDFGADANGDGVVDSFDFDSDGIPNHLDLDSDADGCADAIEGDGTFIISDLTTSTIDGGSTGVQDNLGITVDIDGIPTVLGSPQGIGSSQDPGINKCIPTLTCSVGSFDISTSVFADTFSLSTWTSDVRGIDFNNDGTKLYVVAAQGGSRILEFDLPVQYDVSTAIYVDVLNVGGQDNGPRDVIFNNDGTKVYLVGGNGDAVYEYDLLAPYDVSTGTYVDNFNVSAQETDPFGIGFNNDGTKLYISGNQGDDVNEYNLSVAYDVSTGTYVDSFDVSAQETNMRGMDFSSNGTKLFVTGLNSDAVHQYSLSTPYDVSTGVYVTSFDVSPQDGAPEGMAFNHNGSRLYIMGNDGNDITEYGLTGTGDYPEVPANDGSLDNTNPLSLYATEDTFADLGSGVLTASQVTVDNIPAGLTAVFTIDGPTQITLTFTGNATDHQNTDDVLNLTYTFTDAAFTNYSGADISLAACNVGIDFVDNISTVRDYMRHGKHFKNDKEQPMDFGNGGN
ncbi:MAG: hypothetical protein JKY22_05365, partial [Flavobacteriaceae bacterium]|nr:hypothetical protein [Flavobacteriaceae bacterium]